MGWIEIIATMGIAVIGTVITNVIVYLLKINTMENKIGTLERTSDKIEEKVDGITQQINKIEGKLDTFFDTFLAGSFGAANVKGFVKSNSPRSLTNKGEDLLKLSGADKFILENKDELVDKIRKKSLKLHMM